MCGAPPSTDRTGPMTPDTTDGNLATAGAVRPVATWVAVSEVHTSRHNLVSYGVPVDTDPRAVPGGIRPRNPHGIAERGNI